MRINWKLRMNSSKQSLKLFASNNLESISQIFHIVSACRSMQGLRFVLTKPGFKISQKILFSPFGALAALFSL